RWAGPSCVGRYVKSHSGATWHSTATQNSTVSGCRRSLSRCRYDSAAAPAVAPAVVGEATGSASVTAIPSACAEGNASRPARSFLGRLELLQLLQRLGLDLCLGARLRPLGADDHATVDIAGQAGQRGVDCFQGQREEGALDLVILPNALRALREL